MFEQVLIIGTAMAGTALVTRSVYLRKLKAADERFDRLLGEANALLKEHMKLRQVMQLIGVQVMGLSPEEAGITEPETNPVTKTEGNVIHVDFKAKTKSPTIH